jgi:hypothetical protein
VPICMNSVGNVREKRTEIVGCRFEGFRRRRERYVELNVVSIEVVIVSAECERMHL